MSEVAMPSLDWIAVTNGQRPNLSDEQIFTRLRSGLEAKYAAPANLFSWGERGMDTITAIRLAAPAPECEHIMVGGRCVNKETYSNV